MSQLLCLAKSKNPKGMLPLCNEMVTKTRSLLNIWEPSLVEEAFDFIEQHRILEEPDNALMVSSFRLYIFFMSKMIEFFSKIEKEAKFLLTSLFFKQKNNIL